MLINTSDKIFFGSSPVDRVYLGSILVWSGELAPEDAYYSPDEQEYYVDPTGQIYYGPIVDPIDAYYSPDEQEYYVDPTSQLYYAQSTDEIFPLTFPVTTT